MASYRHHLVVGATVEMVVDVDVVVSVVAIVAVSVVGIAERGVDPEADTVVAREVVEVCFPLP